MKRDNEKNNGCGFGSSNLITAKLAVLFKELGKKAGFGVFAAVLFAVVHGASGETISVSGGEVSYTGAEAKELANGNVVLVFTDTQNAGTLTLPKNAKARIVAVGGGGAGGSMAAVDEIGKGAAGGGGAGGVSDIETTLKPGTYTINVGAGGRRVQTTVQSWVGANGENSSLHLGGRQYALAKGGGGGGTVKLNGRGEDGGSGGGGSWYGSPTKFGGCVDAQGWQGGMVAADSLNNGAGGGGAALTAEEGRGKADGTPGAGRTLDVTGESVVYGRGGRGGVRGDAAYEPADGEGYGFGGDGAGETGRGGAGGDGIVIVCISSVFDYVKVDIPAAFESPTWEKGRTYVAFDYDHADSKLKEAIWYVEGTTNVTASVTNGGSVTNGLGRFHYAIHLKENYVWNDGTAEGSVNPLVVYWRVKEPGIIGEATIDVTKTVNWSDGKDATIEINIKSSPEKVKTEPKVLMLGSLCKAHGFDSKVINSALNAVLKIGDVDYAFYSPTESLTPTPNNQGSYKRGQTANVSVTLENTQHGILYSLYHHLWKVIEAKEHYDYIIFVIDRGLVATRFPGKHDHEEEVVNYLKEFYDRDCVIWLLDDEERGLEGNTQNNNQGHLDSRLRPLVQPWHPGPIVWAGSKDVPGKSGFYGWTTLDCYVYADGYSVQKKAPYGYPAYKAMMGMFDPSMYNVTQEEYDPDISFYQWNTDAQIEKAIRLTGRAIDHQIVYDNAAAAGDLVQQVVKDRPSTIRLADKIFADSGLIVNKSLTSGKWTTNEVTMGWRDLTPEQFVIGNDGRVSIAIEGIRDPADIRVLIGVTDTGAFRTSVKAKFNQQTGLWEKDPNDGSVQVAITPENSEAVLAEAAASTAVAWSFPTYTITCRIKIDEGESEDQGEMVVNGFITNVVEVAAGCTPEVVFRGKGGYVLDYLEVDGIVVEDFDANLYNWIFNEVAADHDVVVGFKELFTVPWPETKPAERVYDGKAAQPEVTTTPTFIPGYNYRWEAVYSMESNGVYTTDGGQVNVVYDANGNVTSTNVYVRIKIYQPGYEDGVVINYWTGIEPVTVTPRPITVKFDDYVQTTPDKVSSGFTYHVSGGSLVDGDVIDENPGKCTSWPTRGNKTTGSVTADGVMKVTTPGCPTCNYVVNIEPGDYFYPDLELVLEAQNIVKYYDGKTTNVTAKVVYPSVETTYGEWIVFSSSKSNSQVSADTEPASDSYYRYRYETNGIGSVSIKYGTSANSLSTTNPSFKDVGVHTVYYKADSVTCTVKLVRQKAVRGGNVLKRTYSWPSTSDDRSKEQSKNNHNLPTPQNATYTSNGEPKTATITILPREVTVTANSAAKKFDGTELTEGGFTVSPETATDKAGFVGTEGFNESSIKMTGDSKIVNVGSVANRIDSGNVKFKSGTSAANYLVNYVDGVLTVSNNTLRLNGAVAPVEKVYDGKPTDSLVFKVIDSDGKVPNNLTITYGTGLDGVKIVKQPEPITDVDYVVVPYTISGPGYANVISGETYIRVKPRTVVLTAGSAEKAYDGTPLKCTEFVCEEPAGDTGFISGDGIASVTMTSSSEITKPGTAKNEINLYDVDNWVFSGNAKPQNYNFVAKPGELTVTRVTQHMVDGDGEFSWVDPEGATPGQTVVVKVDGVVVKEYTITEGGSTNTIHVTNYPDHPNNDKHVIDFEYPNDDSSVFVEGPDWKPAADEEEMYQNVNIDPPETEVEEIKKWVIIENNPESGWMPVYGDDEDGDGKPDVIGLSSPDGEEGGDKVLESSFDLSVIGSGELKFEEITIPVNDETNPDNGSLVITVDGVEYKIPPTQNKNVSYTIVTNGDTIVISNLIIQVTGDSDEAHDVKITYTRNAEDSEDNTSATIKDITWKTYGHTDDGGTSWLDDEDEYKSLMIIDHEPLTDGWVYLAFKPNLRINSDLEDWVKRSAENGKIQVKYGATREECDACEPIVTELSDKTNGVHRIRPIKVWVRVDLNKVREQAGGNVSVTEGFWRICIGASQPNQDAPSPAPAPRKAPKKVSTLGLDDDSVFEQGALQANGTAGQNADSVNVFGIMEIRSTTANTMVAVPWTWYSESEEQAEDIPIKKFVKATNLTPGDMVYASDRGGKAYRAWVLDDDGEWVSINTVQIKSKAESLGLGNIEILDSDEDDDEDDDSYQNATRIERGHALWVVRQNPVDEAGNAIPFWIYGQSVTTTVTTVISGAKDGKVVSTLLGNPYAAEVALNDLVSDTSQIDKNDTIWIYSNDGKIGALTFNVAKNAWKQSVQYIDAKGKTKTGYNYNVKVSPGRGFWYDRYGASDIIISWPKP